MDVKATAFVRARILSNMMQFSAGEKAIAEFILGNPEVVSYSTITLLANRVSTSEASINRFCKKVGFKGFNDFKVAFAQEYFHNSIMSNETKEPLNYAYEVASKYQNLIVHTASLVEDTDLIAAANLLLRAKRTLLYSSSLLEPVMWNFKEKLACGGIVAEWVPSLEMLFSVIHTCSVGTVLLLIIHVGVSEVLMEAVTTAQQNGVQIILVTQNKNPQLSDLANITLMAADASVVETEFPISPIIVPTYLLDMIFSLMLKADKKLSATWLKSRSLINSLIYKNKRYDP